MRGYLYQLYGFTTRRANAGHWRRTLMLVVLFAFLYSDRFRRYYLTYLKTELATTIRIRWRMSLFFYGRILWRGGYCGC